LKNAYVREGFLKTKLTLFHPLISLLSFSQEKTFLFNGKKSDVRLIFKLKEPSKMTTLFLFYKKLNLIFGSI
jgi:hypothetical protein